MPSGPTRRAYSSGSSPGGRTATRVAMPAAIRAPASRSTARAPGGVPVQQQHHRLGPGALEDAQVTGGERGGAEGQHVADPLLVQSEAVEVALHQHGLLLAADLVARLVQAVEHVALVVERGLPGVEVLGPLVAAHHPGAEGQRPPVRTADGDDQPVAEEVEVAVPLLAGEDQARLERPLQGAGLPHPVGELRPAGGGEAQSEAAGGLLGDAAGLEVRPGPRARAPAPRGPEAKWRAARSVTSLSWARSRAAGSSAPSRSTPTSRAEIADGVHEGLAQVALQEGEGRPAGLAAVAVEDALLRVHVEAGRLLLVEGAAPPPLAPGLLQLHVAAHQREHVHAPLDLFQLVLGDQHGGRTDLHAGPDRHQQTTRRP